MTGIGRKKILLVEDEAINALISRRTLEKNGFEVIHTVSGEGALTVTDSVNGINLILMDIDLGDGMDGTEAAEIILSRHDIPLVFLSSHTEPEIVRKTDGITSYGYIVKNSGETVLLASIKMAFRLFEEKKKVEKNEEKLREGEERNRALLDGIPDLMFMFNREGVFVDYKAGDKSQLFVEPDSFIYRHVSDVLPPELSSLTLKNIAKALETGEVQVYEYSTELNGCICHYESRLVPCGEDRALSIVRDITEVRKSHENLKIAEETYRNLFMNSQVGIYRTDMATGKILEANDCFARLFGFRDRGELLGESVRVDRWYVDPSIRDNMISILQEQGEVKNYDSLLRRRDGSEIWIRYSARLIPDKGWIEGVLEDVTAEKNAESIIIIRNEELHAVNEELMAMNEEFEAANEELIETNQKLEEKEEEYRLLFENSPSGIFILQDNRFRIFNDAVLHITGLSRDELYSVSATDLVHHNDLDVVLESNKKITCHESDELSFPFRIIKGNGEVMWVGIKSKFILWKGKKGALCFINDITARKAAEERCIDSENKYKRIFESISDVYYQTDLKGNIVEISPSIEHYSGFTREELIGKPVTDVYCDPLDRGRLVAIIKKHGKVSDYELRLKSKDGRLIITSAISRLLFDSKGNPSGIEGSLRDITERKRIEDVLRGSEENYRLLVENSNSIILRMDRNGNIVFFNNFAEQFFGYSRDEVAGKNVVGTIVPQFDSSGADLQKMILDIACNPEKYNQNENENIRKDGSRVWVSWTNRAVADNSGNVVEVLCIGSDMTFRREAERRIQDLLLEKELFLKETHHRIKNDMNAVYGFLFLQAEEQTVQVCRGILNDAASRVMSMMVLYDKLYRSEDHSGLNIKEYLPQLVRQIVSVFEPRVPVETSIHVEEFVLSADLLSPIGIIINELVTNSMKYAFNGRGSGRIEISAVKKGRTVTVNYKDNGVGIPESVSFEQSSGFGMQLIEMLVQQINGAVEIQRSGGAGFLITFNV